jgi:hypothetical protein
MTGKYRSGDDERTYSEYKRAKEKDQPRRLTVAEIVRVQQLLAQGMTDPDAIAGLAGDIDGDMVRTFIESEDQVDGHTKRRPGGGAKYDPYGIQGDMRAAGSKAREPWTEAVKRRQRGW